MDRQATQPPCDQAAQQEEPQAATYTTPAADHAAACRTCDGEDFAEQVAALVELFLAGQRGQYDQSAQRAFHGAAESVAARLCSAGYHDLAAALQAARADFHAVFDSPLDIDEKVLSLIWDRVRQGTACASAPNTLSAAAAAETSEGDGRLQSRPLIHSPSLPNQSHLVQVTQQRLDEFLEVTSRVSFAVEMLGDLESRMAETGRLASLVEDMRRINRDLKSHSAGLQRSVLDLQRVSLGGLFSKLRQTAQALASDQGRQINVHIAGEDTRIDRLLAERLDAPLTQLVRETVTCGIATPQRRRADSAGEVENLWLSAEGSHSLVTITLRDDGPRIDPAVLRRWAVDRGVLSRPQADALCDEEAVSLVLHPGLHTPGQTAEVPGRAAAMQAVRTAAEEQDGEVTVESKGGSGTAVKLEIPVRQAMQVIDGLLVVYAGRQCVVPLEHVVRIVQLDAADLASANGRPVVTIRGMTCPAVCLGEILELEPEGPAEDDRSTAVLVAYRQRSLCILVDEVLGHRQVMVNSLRELLPGVRKVSGVAPLGGGKLSPVLSVPEIVANL